MKSSPNPLLSVLPTVSQALLRRQPVVALESTVITHGLPRPANLDLARKMEAEVADAGAQPATIAVLDGQIHVGLDAAMLDELALGSELVKINRRDLSVAMAQHLSGGTTVSATMYIASLAGISVLATGGIGGVHRGQSGDVSADLPELARTSIAVVCSGAKSILDLPRTLEWLETAAVPVIGWGTDYFPAFFSRSSGLPVSAHADDAQSIAAMIQAHWGLGLGSGILVCVPCPEQSALAPEEIDHLIEVAEDLAQTQGIRGKDVTPFMLSRLVDLSGGSSLRANLALLRNNAAQAAELAAALQIASRLQAPPT
jgi:pseudouridine-5'-phosphate glycosidase